MGKHKQFVKVLKVIESCKTLKQLEVASKFAKLYFEQTGTAQYMCGFRDRMVRKRKEISE